MKHKMILCIVLMCQFFSITPCFKVVRKNKNTIYKPKTKPPKKPSQRDLKKECKKCNQQWYAKFYQDLTGINADSRG